MRRDYVLIAAERRGGHAQQSQRRQSGLNHRANVAAITAKPAWR